jgi:TolA-binding protein
MKHLRPLIWLLAVSPLLCLAQRKEYVELQREVMQLQEQVRTLQRAVDEKMAELKVLVQQALDNAAKANTAVAVMDAGMRDRLKEQAASLVGPVAAIGAKVDQMASEFQGLKTAIEDMNGRLGKVERQMVDLGNTVKVLQAPPPAPAGPPGPPAGVSAESLYASAMGDKDKGNYDLAMQGFTDYLKYFGETATAPNAQFYIGEIHYRRGDLDAALRAFDLVLEKYSENNKTLDAMFMKGLTLVKMGQRNRGAEEFWALIDRSPTSELAAKARAQLKSLGLSPLPPGKRTTKKKTTK